MLIAMAVHCTDENKRTPYLQRTMQSLIKTVNFTRHRLFICDNASCKETRDYLQWIQKDIPFTVISFEKNQGTAVAINKAWKERSPGEHCVKMDDDVEIHEPDWADMMVQVFEKDPEIGICGLKRKDLAEWPLNETPWYKSELIPLPHIPGERWIVVESVIHVFGTCQAYSSTLLDRIGYLYQMQDHGNIYGFDDSLASIRAEVAGFKRVFIPGINIDHIDPGGTGYTKWKKENAGVYGGLFHTIKAEYQNGTRDVYYGGP